MLVKALLILVRNHKDLKGHVNRFEECYNEGGKTFLRRGYFVKKEGEK